MIELAYGRAGLSVELPDDRTTVIEPAYVPGLPDQAGALRDAISNPIGTPPLRELVRSDQTVAISVCDITRPMPTATVLPVLLAELTRVPRERITILIATGTHRTNTPEEVEEMLGHDIALSYQVVNHNAFDAAGLERVGDTSEGVPIWLNRRGRSNHRRLRRASLLRRLQRWAQDGGSGTGGVRDHHAPPQRGDDRPS